MLLRTLSEEKWAEARAYFEQSLKADPSCTRSHIGLAEALVELKLPDEALRVYEQALEVSPWSPQVLNNLGVLLHELDRLDEAAHYLEKAERIELDGLAAANLARVLLDMGRDEAAIPHLEMAVGRRPDDVDLIRRLADLCFEQRQTARVIRHLNVLLVRDGKDTKAKIQLTWALATSRDASKRDGERAMAIGLEALQETRQEDPAALAALAAAMAEAGRTKEALALATRARRLPARGTRAARLVTDLPRQIQAYREGRPYRE